MTDNQQPQETQMINQYPCADHERRIALTEQSVASLRATNEGITTKLDLILAQVTRVALLEEKHTNLMTDNNRAHSKIGHLEKEIADLGLEAREFMNYTKGQNRILWIIGSAVAGLFIKIVFFAAHGGMTP